MIASLAQNAGRSGPQSPIDGPPPNPTAPMNPMAGSGGGLGPAGTPSARQLPQEMLMGLLTAGQSVGEMLDSMAQMAPDIAAECAGAKELLQRGLAKLMVAGGGVSVPGAPTSPMPGVTPVAS